MSTCSLQEPKVTIREWFFFSFVGRSASNQWRTKQTNTHQKKIRHEDSGELFLIVYSSVIFRFIFVCYRSSTWDLTALTLSPVVVNMLHVCRCNALIGVVINFYHNKI